MTALAISETVSETTKRHRGRPADGNAAMLRGLWPDDGPRSIRNKAAMSRAVAWLVGEPGLGWLFEGARDLDGKLLGGRPGQRWHRASIFYELGRLSDKQTAIAFAHRLCELQPPTTRRAVAMVRRVRVTGRGEARGNVETLAVQLARVVDDFTARYPHTPSADLVRAVRRVLDIVATERGAT